MSDYKQEQQIKNNDLFDNYLSDNSPDIEDNTVSEDNDEKHEPTIWDELNDMRDKLRGFDIRTVKSYINSYLKDDVAEIKKQFHTQFDNIENDDDLKIEVLILLGELGIQINKKINLPIVEEDEKDSNSSYGHDLEDDDEAFDEGSYTDDDEKKECCTNIDEITYLSRSLSQLG